MKLPSSWDLPEAIKNRLGRKSSGQQRAMVADGHLLLVLHQVPQHGKRDREAVFFWRKPEGNWEYSGRGIGLPALKKHLEDYSTAAEKLSQKYEQAELAEDYFQILEELVPLQRAAQNLHATLQAAREAISGDREIIDFRDGAAEIDRTLELLYLDTKNALDFKIAKQTEEQAQLSLQSLKAAHRLNILAAIFFPLTAISCVFGMNLPSGFENASTGVFWLVFLGGMTVGFFVRRWVARGKWF
jgi:Mg2+ and Co2+ transporter CorA